MTDQLVEDNPVERFLRVKEVKEVLLPKAFEEGKKVAMHFELSIDGERMLFAIDELSADKSKDDLVLSYLRVLHGFGLNPFKK